jgi:hypothetical protein
MSEERTTPTRGDVERLIERLRNSLMNETYEELLDLAQLAADALQALTGEGKKDLESARESTTACAATPTEPSASKYLALPSNALAPADAGWAGVAVAILDANLTGEPIRLDGKGAFVVAQAWREVRDFCFLTMFNDDGLRSLLKLDIRIAGGPGKYCEERGLCYEQLRLFQTGARPAEPAILAAMKMERATFYRPAKPSESPNAG